jgi:hypothetical protein
MLSDLLPNFRTIKEIGVHKGLAQIGDSITNLGYSAAKSRINRKIEARNVNRTILSMALKQAGMKQYAKNRADSHEMADTAEAFIGYVVCSEKWSIDILIDKLTQKMQGGNFSDYRQEIATATDAFTQILKEIKQILLSEFPDTAGDAP